MQRSVGARHSWIRLCSVLLAIAAGSIWLSDARVCAGAEPNDEAVADALADLHQGRYTRAEQKLRAVAAGAPDDPESRFLIAFVRWWRALLDGSDRDEEDPVFDAAIEATLTTGEHRIERQPDDSRALAAVGGAHILRSHVEARHRHYFKAAHEARRGKKLLEEALRGEPRLETALFPLGAYNYYADKVPLIVKGIRFLLFLPGGDASRGLRDIHTVAASHTSLRTDARLLLAIICGGTNEGAYRDARAHLRLALEEHPGSPLIAGALGELEMRLGNYPEATRVFDAALRSAADGDPDRILQRRRLRISLAEALVADWRLARGERMLGEAIREYGEFPSSLHKAMIRVQQELGSKRDGAPYWIDEGEPPLVDSAMLLRVLDDAARSRPEDPLPRFLRGRALFERGRFAEAREEMQAAARRTVDPPAWMEGWIELYAGMAERRLDDERAARAHFRRASEVRHFRSADRGLLELQGPGGPNPECAP